MTIRPWLPAILLLVLLLPLREADAKDKPTGDDPGGEEDPGDEEDGDDHGDDHADGPVTGHAGGDHHHRFVVGAKGAGLWLKSEHHEAALYGGGVFGEVALIHEWLEIELGVKLLTQKGGDVHVPIDLLVKKPFSVPNATLYLGIGPALNILNHEGETHAYFGVAGAIGVYLWIKDPFGINFELLESVVFEEEVTNELGGAAGVVFGF